MEVKKEEKNPYSQQLKEVKVSHISEGRKRGTGTCTNEIFPKQLFRRKLFVLPLYNSLKSLSTNEVKIISILAVIVQKVSRSHGRRTFTPI